MTEQHALHCGLEKAAKKLGIHLTWHGHRHWTGTMLCYEVYSGLGHADVSATANCYVHFSRNAGKEAAQVASKLLDGWDNLPAFPPGTGGVNPRRQEQPVVSF